MKSLKGCNFLLIPFLYIAHAMRVLTFTYRHKYNKQWDLILNKIMDENAPFTVMHSSLIFYSSEGEWRVWVDDYWPSYATPSSFNGIDLDRELQVRPSFKTQLRLKKHIEETSGLPQNFNEFISKHIDFIREE